MAVHAPSDCRQVLVRERENPRRLARITIAALDSRDDFVWVCGDRTGKVIEAASALVAAERPAVFALSPDVRGLRSDDGQRVVIFTNADPTYRGPGTGTGMAVGWWGEGPKPTDENVVDLDQPGWLEALMAGG